jgi:uncharacterized protein (DUF169 family)
MATIEEYRKAGQELFDKLHLATYPVAIKYIKDIKEIPDKAIRPVVKGHKMAICQAYTQARRFGDTYAITAEDNFCTPSSVGHGWVPITEEEFIESQIRQGWSKDPQAERRRAEEAYGKNFKNVIALGYRGVVASPLPETLVVPDTVLTYADGRQLTYLIHALTFEHRSKYAIRSSFEGFGESCGKGGFLPFITRKPQLVIPGAGDRSFAGIQDHELAIGMPAKYVFYVLENLFKVGRGQGLKLPLRQILPLNLNENLTPGFKYMREVIDKKLKEE